MVGSPLGQSLIIQAKALAGNPLAALSGPSTSLDMGLKAA
jgi:hypothetical protein